MCQRHLAWPGSVSEVFQESLEISLTGTPLLEGIPRSQSGGMEPPKVGSFTAG